MNRCVAAVLLGMALAGCAQDGAARPSAWKGPAAPGDPAGLAPKAAAAGDGARPGAAAPPPADDRVIPAGSPAPPAEPQGGPRPQLPPTRRAEGRPALPPEPDPAPAAGIAPASLETTGFYQAPDSPIRRQASDPEVRRTSLEQPSEMAYRPAGQMLGGAVAIVGKETITWRQLVAAVRDILDDHPNQPRPTDDELNMLATGVLESLIDRKLVVQQARKEIKKKEMFQGMVDKADEIFREHELPKILHRYHAADLNELTRKLEARNRSYEMLREDYRQQFIMQQFLLSKLGDQITPRKPDLEKYYREHRQDYDRPEQIVWREIAVRVDGDGPGRRAEARRRAEALLDRLRHGEPFDAVARQSSQGSTAQEGGRHESGVGSFAVPAVNAYLEAARPMAISPILEGPRSFHIVRLESRRPAGPASFAEVQDDVKEKVARQLREKVFGDYLADLRKHILVTSPMFEGTSSFPSTAVSRTASP